MAKIEAQKTPPPVARHSGEFSVDPTPSKSDTTSKPAEKEKESKNLSSPKETTPSPKTDLETPKAAPEVPKNPPKQTQETPEATQNPDVPANTKR